MDDSPLKFPNQNPPPQAGSFVLCKGKEKEMTDRYLSPQQGARWAISAHVGDRSISLVENSRLDDQADAEQVLTLLGIEITAENLDRYFPVLSIRYGRCPNLDVLELCCLQDPTNPLRDAIQQQRAHAAV